MDMGHGHYGATKTKIRGWPVKLSLQGAPYISCIPYIGWMNALPNFVRSNMEPDLAKRAASSPIQGRQGLAGSDPGQGGRFGSENVKNKKSQNRLAWWAKA